MENAIHIAGICNQLRRIYERIDALTSDLQAAAASGATPLVEEYREMRMEELEQAQRLTIMLTQVLTQEEGNGDDSAETEEVTSAANADESGGSVFGPMELTSCLGDKTDDTGEESEQ